MGYWLGHGILVGTWDIGWDMGTDATAESVPIPITEEA